MNSVIIDGIEVDTEIFSFRFECDYSQCKGYCCWGEIKDKETIGGCILSDAEYKLLERNKMVLARYVDEDLLTFLKKPLTIEEEGVRVLRANGSCCVLCNKTKGSCAISLARKDDRISFGIPVWGSFAPLMLVDDCHLVIDKDMFYDYECCQKSLEKSKRNGRFVWQFLKPQIVDYFGEDFYNQLAEEANKWI